MKKPLRYMLSVVLMLALMLSMGTAAFADNTADELPVEYVSYGVGLPDAPGVDRHGLGDDAITIDGVSWKPRTSVDKLYVHVLDLAAAKLLRCCADEAEELGLDYAKLYIENGLIQVMENVPAAEAEELKGKVDKLTRAAVIGLVAGDTFDVGNGGDVKLQVRIAGFVTGAENTAAASKTAKRGLDIKGIGAPVIADGLEFDRSCISAENFTGVTTTTVYIIYGGYTEYWGPGEADPSIQTADGDAPQAKSDNGRRDGWHEGYVGIVRAAGDENEYWIKVVGIGDEKFIRYDDIVGADENGIWENRDDQLAEITGSNFKDYGKLADKIIIATDAEGNNVVMTIDLKDATAKPEDIYEINEDGSAALKEEPPEGYEEPNDFEDADEFPQTDMVKYDPEEIVEVDRPGEDTAEVTIRENIIAENPNHEQLPD